MRDSPALRMRGSILGTLVMLVVWSLLLLVPFPMRAATAEPDGPDDPQELEAFLDPFFAEQMEKLHIPGAVFVLVKNGEIFFAKGYGFADLEKKIPVDPDKTIFRVASVSKLFTATAVMQLYEKGQLGLGDDVNKYLRDFKLESNYRNPITIAHLLTHTGGLDERYIGLFARSESEALPLGQYLAKRMPPRVLPPSEVISYSNHGMALAGYLVETISGIPFAQHIEENILNPLGMERSSFLLPVHLRTDLAQGYEYQKGSYQPVPLDHINTTPSSSLTTTATDIAHFIIAHLQNGRYRDISILRDATAQEMHSRHFTHHPRLPGVAYGFFEGSVNNQRAISHDGAIAGFSSRLFLLPDQNLGFFVACNTSYRFKFIEGLTKQILDHYYPVRTLSAPPETAAGFQDGARQFTGTYRSMRYSRRTVEKLMTLLEQLSVTDNGDGSLTLRFPGDEGTRIRGVEGDPLLFRSVEGENYFAFRKGRKGHITHLFLGSEGFEKLPWFETAVFQETLIGLFALIFLSACAAWLFQYLFRRFRNRPPEVIRSIRLAQSLSVLVSALNLLFLIRLVLAVLQIDEQEFEYGMPPVLRAFLCIPLLTTALTVGMPVLAAIVWKNEVGSVLWRCHHTLVTSAALAFVPFLRYWNLLGFRY